MSVSEIILRRAIEASRRVRDEHVADVERVARLYADGLIRRSRGLPNAANESAGRSADGVTGNAEERD